MLFNIQLPSRTAKALGVFRHRAPYVEKAGCFFSIRLVSRKEKGSTLFSVEPFGIHPAATYSPTQLPMQYHRRKKA
jgi:hypothetical protein